MPWAIACALMKLKKSASLGDDGRVGSCSLTARPLHSAGPWLCSAPNGHHQVVWPLGARCLQPGWQKVRPAEQHEPARGRAAVVAVVVASSAAAGDAVEPAKGAGRGTRGQRCSPGKEAAEVPAEERTVPHRWQRKGLAAPPFCCCSLAAQRHQRGRSGAQGHRGPRRWWSRIPTRKRRGGWLGAG